METKTTATLKLDGFALTAEGVLGGSEDWTLITTFDAFLPMKYQRVNIHFWDEDEVAEFLWEEAVEIIQSQNGITFEHEEVEDLDS